MFTERVDILEINMIVRVFGSLCNEPEYFDYSLDASCEPRVVGLRPVILFGVAYLRLSHAGPGGFCFLSPMDD